MSDLDLNAFNIRLSGGKVKTEYSHFEMSQLQYLANLVVAVVHQDLSSLTASEKNLGIEVQELIPTLRRPSLVGGCIKYMCLLERKHEADREKFPSPKLRAHASWNAKLKALCKGRIPKDVEVELFGKNYDQDRGKSWA